ncbi:sulfite exporter TauE/SafE family protein [uncultured Draconibacterium sp.]|uniref:sulfite exporter TauE/SafE family protein n=1 Tax=uncultured Draconibacterium sp. TaxID=1573823 RepID=UPI0032607B14
MLDLQLILILLLAGSLAGFIAGLFGVGGGIIVVPVTLWVLKMQQVESEYIQHIAVGTSLTVMVFTTFMSSLGHYRKKAIHVEVFKSMAPGIVLGSVAGSLLASSIPSKSLQIVFIIFAYLVSIKTLVGFNPNSSWNLPKPLGIFSIGTLFGGISGLLGIGGGVFNVPFLLACKVPIKKAVGTSAALSWSVAVSGTISYLWTGFQVADLPEGTFGFCYFPVAITLIITTSIFAPLGVKLTHALSPKIMQLIFGLMLLGISTQILFEWVILK